MNRKRKFLNISLLFLVILLGGVAVWIFRLPPPVSLPLHDRHSFGIYDNRQLVRLTGISGTTSYQVEDSLGNFLFSIPLKDCMIDRRFRSGKLRFHDNASGREGFIDSMGFVSLQENSHSDILAANETVANNQTQTKTPSTLPRKIVDTEFADIEILLFGKNHPFAEEAKKLLMGKLSVDDSISRRKILSYCEHLRTAYTTKDIDFIRQVFSEHALIIVGHTVKSDSSVNRKLAPNSKVSYSTRTKHQYLSKLQRVFDSNNNISVDFSDFKIMRHPTMEGIYGVSLHQKYKSDRYSDDGYLFLLWDFRDKSMPLIHVRTWQPNENILLGEDVIDISDFNLQ